MPDNLTLNVSFRFNDVDENIFSPHRFIAEAVFCSSQISQKHAIGFILDQLNPIFSPQ
jgi:hypothetical protein